MHKPESVMEYKTHKILWDFEIQTDHLIPARRLDLVIKKKKKEISPYSGFCCPSESQSINKRKRNDRQILGPRQRPKKAVDH